MSDPASNPGVYTIAPNLPFTDTLVAGITAQSGASPLTLANYRILLPTRRSCRSMREAFLRQSGGNPVLLPRMTPIGDVDEDDLLLTSGDPLSGPAGAALDIPPAIPGLKRQLILMKLISMRSLETSADQAALLAAELASLIDQVATEQLDFAALEGLVDKDLSEHWQETLKFLEIVTESWPAILADQGMLDPASRRNLLLQAQSKAWQENPPQSPVIAAGSTGSIPATAELLTTIATMPASFGLVMTSSTAPPMKIRILRKAMEAEEPITVWISVVSVVRRDRISPVGVVSKNAGLREITWL